MAVDNLAVDLQDLELGVEMGPELHCRICAFHLCEPHMALTVHNETLRHKYNFILENYNRNKKSKVKDRHGIEVGISALPLEVAYFNTTGAAKTAVEETANPVRYIFTVKNISKRPIHFMEAQLLHPLHVFNLEFDVTSVADPLRQHESRDVKVTFESNDVGLYQVPVCLHFHRKGHNFHIIKLMVVEVVPNTVVFLAQDEEENELSPFRGEPWHSMLGNVPRQLMNGRPLQEKLPYKIPADYFQIFLRRLKLWDGITDDQLLTFRQILLSFPAQCLYNKGFKEQHNVFFHAMLWLDEFSAKYKLRMYNMVYVPMRLVKNQYLVELRVPGLAEKRPSVIKGDIVVVRVSLPSGFYETQAYEGQIAQVFESVVWIRDFNQHLMYRLNDAELMGVQMMFDVRFTLNRWPMYVMHSALDSVKAEGNLDVIFPESTKPLPSLVTNNHYKFFNADVSHNSEQKVAVHNIVNGSSRPAPYILFGPPGTGKTVTLVEAVLQIKILFRTSHVLVCAPSNSACDHITQLLMPHCTTQELIRWVASSRDTDLVPRDLHPYINKKSEQLKMDDLKKYRIVVCTLVGAAKFCNEREYHFTHVFIDEAAQAEEPQALVAIGGILGSVSPKHPGGQLILAGDPKQLGPICISPLAEKAGLGLSMMERLMTHCDLYQRGEDDKYNHRYITKLLDNFRSHPNLLHLPNRLFYDGELKAKCGPDVLNDPLCMMPILKTKGPLIFHGVIGQEFKEGKSPSYFNPLEISQVMKYVSALLSPDSKTKVEQSQIGVISPYIRQVYKLKHLFEANNWSDVEVGTTEVFQGREKRVIIISTVRANPNLLDHDRNFKLGFLVNEKRFNVAVTRARSLLIIVGSPHILDQDNCWNELLSLSKEQNSYSGCKFNIRENQWTNAVINRVQVVSNEEA